MIQYAIDTEIRRHVIYVLAVASSLAAGLGGSLLTPFAIAPSGMACFGLLYTIFDRWIWRYSRASRYLGIPDLNGLWEGTISRRDFQTGQVDDFPVSVTINQTWTRLDIVLEKIGANPSEEDTRSFTKAAALSVSNEKVMMIRHIWAFQKGQGFSEMRVHTEDNKPRLIGEYTSNQGKQGKISLQRAS